jgi:hypothetical protein
VQQTKEKQEETEMKTEPNQRFEKSWKCTSENRNVHTWFSLFHSLCTNVNKKKSFGFGCGDVRKIF